MNALLVILLDPLNKISMSIDLLLISMMKMVKSNMLLKALHFANHVGEIAVTFAVQNVAF